MGGTEEWEDRGMKTREYVRNVPAIRYASNSLSCTLPVYK